MNSAIIVCDVWDKHWCKRATEVSKQKAPEINKLLLKARAKKFLIIHSPSETIGYYRDHPCRKLITDPIISFIKYHRQNKMRWFKDWPINDKDRMCGCIPKCTLKSVWKKQHPSITLHNNDYIADNENVIENVLSMRNINQLFFVGFHSNFCLLERPFGIINQTIQRKRSCKLVSDLTDSIFNPKNNNNISHLEGNKLILDYINDNICDVVKSEDIL